MALQQVLALMADGDFHSGEELGECLGVSRAAVWKTVRQLEQELGIEVHAVKGKGYRLAEPLELLDAELLQSLLTSQARSRLPILDLQLKIDSTNLRVKQFQQQQQAAICLAEMQTAGRGRMGRPWVSPFARNLHLSFLWQFSPARVPLDGLSLVVGMGLIKALGGVIARQSSGLGLEPLTIKWPNDILYDGAKLAGILIEVIGELEGPMQVVIGIGVNVAMTERQGANIEQRWTSLQRIAAVKLSRNLIVAEVLNRLADDLLMFESRGFAAFADEWRGLDFLQGRTVEIRDGSRGIAAGIARGVNRSGALLVETAQGLQAYHGGDVSVRGWQ